ncbi:MAG: thermostable hemolysin [Pseudomonadota bacterium]
MTECLTMPSSIDVASGDARPVVRCGHRHLYELHRNSTSEQRAADFIRRRFLQAYGARPTLHMPPLMALVSEHGTLLAAVGLRRAAGERLFLEDYLDRPVESGLPEAHTRRDSVVEIAHLAGVETGISRPLFAALALWLQHAGFRWVVCTGTVQLRNGLRHLGIEVVEMGDANPRRLVDAGAGWGSYYQCQPRVLAIDVGHGVESLRTNGLLRQLQLIEPDAADVASMTRISGGGYGHTA